ncbi:hypothetical protein LEADMM068B1_02895 [Leclercia adecarboxylata]
MSGQINPDITKNLKLLQRYTHPLQDSTNFFGTIKIKVISIMKIFWGKTIIL